VATTSLAALSERWGRRPLLAMRAAGALVLAAIPSWPSSPEDSCSCRYFELRRQLSGAENVSVRYRRGGEEHTFVCEQGRCNDAELAQPYSRWMGRLLYFRPVDKGSRMLCRH